MKKNFYIIIIGILVWVLSASLVNAQNEEELVKKIREQFTQINNSLQTYQLTETELYESSEGGSLKTYTNNENKIVLIRAEFFGEMGKSKEDFYFWEEKLFFAYYVTENYSAPVYVESSEVITKSEQRYYFDNNKMIRWLDNKTKMDKTSELFNKTEKQILSDYKRFLE